ncbi:NAD-dependent epimerase/dehydratase family protein [Sphingomonas sp. CFBP 13728]|uniref:NAD-dependent epimerase/dehydratase family protein n=1 Tax=Sphingomonas sp. CFBP 13728 TaxID=2775294 RepID=UPI0017869F6C|nr:NAD-dependent epimerase/dehydratase family protein [Sphingomonas sp. CFBP 13728]MBD8620606.1 NAD-dependent epimerase/dehydratase family protein [Sphingomonas sp. CFBP 13728]
MRVLVTGGLGFIGTELCRTLGRLGHETVIVDSVTTQVHGETPVFDLPAGASLVRLDVRDLPLRYDVLEGVDVVFHLAAETGTGQSMYQIQRYVDVNDRGTAALLEAIAQCSTRPRKVVLTSSRSVYGEGAYRDNSGRIVQPNPRTRGQLESGAWEPCDDDGAPLHMMGTPETLPFAPGSIYAATKASQELLMSAASEALGFTAVTLRLQNVYGAGQSLQNPYTGIISIFFNRARQGMMLPIYEDGRETRDFVHVDDVVAGLVAAMTHDVPSGTVCNIGSGIATSVNELAAELLRAGGLDVPVEVTGQFRVGDIRHNFADINRARTLLGYAPQVALTDGLAGFCAWASGEPVYADRLDKATEELKAKGLAN